MLEEITISTFKVNDRFRIYYGDDKYVELQLVSIKKSKYSVPNMKREPFILTFTSDRGVDIQSGTYRMLHETLGECEMGLSQLAPEFGVIDKSFFEAVFY